MHTVHALSPVGTPPPTKAWSPAAQSQLAAIAQSRRRTHNRELPHVSPPPLPRVREWERCGSAARVMRCALSNTPSMRMHTRCVCARCCVQHPKPAWLSPPNANCAARCRWEMAAVQATGGRMRRRFCTASFASCARRQGTAVELEAAEARNFVSEPLAHARVEPRR